MNLTRLRNIDVFLPENKLKNFKVFGLFVYLGGQTPNIQMSVLQVSTDSCRIRHLIYQGKFYMPRQILVASET
jgi:hypothetical protein